MKPGLDKPLAETTCESCGQCVATCPTAALTVRADAPKPGPWDLTKWRSTCSFCGTGCAIDLNTVGGKLVLVTPGGRQPLRPRPVRVHGGVGQALGAARAAWARALGGGLGRGPGRRGARPRRGRPRRRPGSRRRLRFTAPHERGGLPPEGTGRRRAFHAERVLVRARRRGPRLRRARAARSGGRRRPRRTTTCTAADTLVLIDSDIAEEQTVAAIAVRKAVRRGARLIVISPDETRMARLAETWVRVERGRLGAFLAGAVATAPSVRAEGPVGSAVQADRSRRAREGRRRPSSAPRPPIPQADAVASALAGPGRAVLVANAAAFDPASVNRDAALAVALAAVAGKACGRGSGVLLLRMRANGQGLTDVGFTTDAARLLGDMERGVVRAALIVGEDPVAGAREPDRVRAALSKLAFLGVLDAVSTRTTELAGVVLPVPAFAEVNGSYTNSERRVQLVQGPLAPPGGLTTLEVLGGIARAARGSRRRAPCPGEVREEMAAAMTGLDFPADPGPDGHRWGGDLPCEGVARDARTARWTSRSPTPSRRRRSSTRGSAMRSRCCSLTTRRTWA